MKHTHILNAFILGVFVMASSHGQGTATDRSPYDDLLEATRFVQNYRETNRYERDHPDPEPPAKAAQVSADVANALAGRWTGRPRLATIDYDIFLEFTKNADGTVQGKLIGTNLKTFRGKVSQTIDKPVRDFTMKDRRMDFEFPNTQPWTFAGELSSDGTSLSGTVNSAQGGMPITFTKR